MVQFLCKQSYQMPYGFIVSELILNWHRSEDSYVWESLYFRTCPHLKIIRKSMLHRHNLMPKNQTYCDKSLGRTPLQWHQYAVFSKLQNCITRKRWSAAYRTWQTVLEATPVLYAMLEQLWVIKAWSRVVLRAQCLNDKWCSKAQEVSGELSDRTWAQNFSIQIISIVICIVSGIKPWN